MSGQGVLQRANRAVKTGGPPAAITAGIGIGATGVTGDGIETRTDPVANGAASVVGTDPQMGPVLLLAAAVFVLAVAFVVPALFDDGRY